MGPRRYLDARPPVFLRLRRRAPRSSSGLFTAEIMPVATRV
jgi:hypothetical protein